MRSRKEMALKSDAMTVTWCVCAHCASTGPRFITLVCNDRELITRLRLQCCGANELACGDDERDTECFEDIAAKRRPVHAVVPPKPRRSDPSAEEESHATRAQ